MHSHFKINSIAFISIVRKEIARFMRIWPQTMLPSVITTSLYFLIFGDFLGSRLGTIHDIKYMTYIAPGFIIMVIITNAYNNVASSFFSERFQSSHQEFVWSPISYHTMICGFIAGGILRGILTGFLVTMIALMYTKIHISHPITMIIITALTASLFAISGFINALFANRFDSIATIPNFVLTPLIYLGGVFYSIELLPPLWQSISLFNPILYIVNAFRYSMLGVADVPVATAMTAIFSINIILYTTCYMLVKKGVGVKE
ncbi:MAG: ABC transporter permease [Legionellales bacterium]|jgi:ABC-2 type transport system permease protein|nr:ABC transporter permease [Legionellales bacterium]